MTPRKELFVAMKDVLKTIPELEWVDLFRNQFGDQHWTAAFIRIGSIRWGTMTQNKQEGDCVVDVLFYCKDGWMDQHHKTEDPEDGLNEIDLIDAIVDKLQFIYGEHFTPLQQNEEEDEEQEIKGIMSYRLSFETKLYRTLKTKYTSKKVTLNN